MPPARSITHFRLRDLIRPGALALAKWCIPIGHQMSWKGPVNSNEDKHLMATGINHVYSICHPGPKMLGERKAPASQDSIEEVTLEAQAMWLCQLYPR